MYSTGVGQAPFLPLLKKFYEFLIKGLNNPSLFAGGPGGGKTRHAARVQEALDKFGLVHICMPDMIRAAIAKYQNTYPEWKEAAQRYQRGLF